MCLPISWIYSGFTRVNVSDAHNVTNHGPLCLEGHDLSAYLYTPSHQAVGDRGETETILVKGMFYYPSFAAYDPVSVYEDVL